MKTLLKRLLCAALCLMLLPLQAFALDEVPEDTAKKLKAMFQKYNTLGASVAVFRNGEVTAVYTFGNCWITGPDITPETAFQVGSISKMISNIGLMQLLAKNNISLETELGDVLGYPVRHPDFPDTPVTLRQLMTHTASLHDAGDYNLAIQGEARSLQVLFTNRAKFNFIAGQEPGTQYAYSNLGGGIIGSLIETLSGQTAEEYMRQNVFGPLGINAAYTPETLRGSLQMADMYNMEDRRIAHSLREEHEVITECDPEHHFSTTAGKLIITAQDLCKLLIVLCDGGVYQNTRILRESDAAAITTLQDHTASVACETSAGLFLNIVENSEVEGRVMYGHGGKAYGMLCAAYFDPTDRTGVVMLTNGCNNTSVHNGVGMLGRQILTICYNDLINPSHEAADPFLVD